MKKRKFKQQKKDRYIVNGKTFESFESALTFCESQNFRITKTETIKPGIF